MSTAVVSDEFIAVVQADVVEWPRLSQAVRLEREAADTHGYYYSVYDHARTEVAIFYSWVTAQRFTMKYGYLGFERKPILKQY